jgi:hypothetical protein
MKTLRTAVPVLALAALAAAGCFLISGQFVFNYAFPTPLNLVSAATLTGVDVDLNTVSEYNDHKDKLKRIEDMALVGDFRNHTGSAASVETWIVPSAAMNLSLAQVQAQGIRLWGPLAVGANSTVSVNWDQSSTLFVGRQTLIDEIKGDGRFSVYVIANGAFNLTVTDGQLIVVVGATN